MGIYEADIYALLKPVAECRTARTKEELINRMAQALEQVPGTAYNFTQPMAMRRLTIVLPLSVPIIFGLLFATFVSAPQAFLILLNVPFALVGGVAALNGIVMVSYINTLRARGMNCAQAVLEGAATRLLPVLYPWFSGREPCRRAEATGARSG